MIEMNFQFSVVSFQFSVFSSSGRHRPGMEDRVGVVPEMVAVEDYEPMVKLSRYAFPARRSMRIPGPVKVVSSLMKQPSSNWKVSEFRGLGPSR
jgi:hypothetical protein